MASIGGWIQGARPWTLTMGASPVVIGASVSWNRVMTDVQGGSVTHAACPVVGGRSRTLLVPGQDVCVTSSAWFLAVAALCLVVSLALQIAANYLNDYFDGVRGVDEGRNGIATAGAGGVGGAGVRGGGGSVASTRPVVPSRLVASGIRPRSVLKAGVVALAVAAVAGLAVVVLTGHASLLVVGALSVPAAWAYTGGRRPYGYRGWGEAMSFLFFGPVACVGTQWALMGGLGSVAGLDPSSVVLSLVPGCCSACLMMVNNLRDLPSDAASGKRTLMVRLGRRRGARLFSLSMAVVVVLPILFLCSREPWSRMGETDCGVASDGVRSCLQPGPSVPLTWTIVVCAGLLAVAGAASVAMVRGRRWLESFRLCSVVAVLSCLLVSLTAVALA